MKKISLMIASAVAAALMMPFASIAPSGPAPKLKFDAQKVRRHREGRHERLPDGELVPCRHLQARRPGRRVDLHARRRPREGGRRQPPGPAGLIHTLDGEPMNGGVIIATRPVIGLERVEVMKRVRSRTSVNVLAVDRNAFQALSSSLPPLRGFFEQLIAARLKGSGGRMASAS